MSAFIRCRQRSPAVASVQLRLLGSFIKVAGALARAATLTAAFAPAFAQTALDDVMAKKHILIAVPTDSAPYGFVGTDLALHGLDVDMANLIGAKLGVKVERVPVTSANRIPYLQAKKADW